MKFHCLRQGRALSFCLVAALALAALVACEGADKAEATGTQRGDDKVADVKKADAKKADAPKKAADKMAASPKDMKFGLLVAMSQFPVGPDKKIIAKPGAARLEIMTREGGVWKTTVLEDPESNVFHKAMVYTPPGQKPGILTLGGTKARLKLWRKVNGEFKAETLWSVDFGGKHNRMRDAEVANLYGDGDTLAVATHDQGVVATVKPGKSGKGWTIQELDKKKKTFVHEIEIGDLNGDKVLEVYATPSEPNRFDGHVQSGLVMRYLPSKGGEGVVVADLGDRHAKEILVTDMDGDGLDELYVAVEAKVEKKDGKSKVVTPVQILRYTKDTDPKEGQVIATLSDRLCRFLTAGDVDGDGKKELIAAPFKSGLWMLRPGADPSKEWTRTLVDKKSAGFEHASILLDLDEDGKDELYVASDAQGELRRYDWNGSGFDMEVISKREVPRSIFTWNLMPVPLSLLK